MVSLIENVFNSGNSVVVGYDVQTVFTLTQSPSEASRLTPIEGVLGEAQGVEIIVSGLTLPGV